jgi:parallel beta-helix repeat protein
VRIAVRRGGIAGIAALTLLGIGVPVAAQAAASGATLYVSPNGGQGDDSSCAQAGYSSIQTAVSAAPAGGTVVVCAGTYAESVTIGQPLTLAGHSGAVIDATGQPYGVGMTADYVTVSGLTIRNAAASDQAPGDGIITAGFGEQGPVAGNYETIINNNVFHNDGAGIDVETSQYTTVAGNVTMHNGIGVNVVDDFGTPAAHNRIIGNRASKNPGGCGIVLAEHSGAGVFDNLVRGNIANNNGLGTPSAPNASAGSGIIIAGGGTQGGVHNNTVESNEFFRNGHGGIAIHVHSPGLNFNGNRLLDNVIGKNNLRTDTEDLKSTGVYIGVASHINVLLRGNAIRRNWFGVFTAGPVTIGAKNTNTFHHVHRDFKSVSTYPSGG